MDAVPTEGQPSKAPKAEASVRPLEEGVTRVRDILRRNLGAEGTTDVIPAGKTITGITQENFRWPQRYYEGPDDQNPNDGEIYSIRFQDGTASFFTHSKVPAWNPWRNFAAGAAGVMAMDWAVNNIGTYNGKDKMELVIAVDNPTAKGPVADKYTATFDGSKTVLVITKANGETETQEYEGDRTQPELLLEEWRKLVQKNGKALETIEYSNPPVDSPAPVTPTV